MLSQSDSSTIISTVSPRISPGNPKPTTPPHAQHSPLSSSPEEEAEVNLTTTTASIENETPSPSSPPAQSPLSWPSNANLSLDWIRDLMSVFEWSSRNLPPSHFPSVLPVPVFDSLVLSASKILHKEPNCVTIDGCGVDSSVVVVGDVHGQLHDVIFLLQDAGFPSENRFFVFNGDYVDRGAWGLETFLLLLAWKVYMPHRVYLLRGNHESKYCTSVYGFEKEVMTKYGDKGKHVYRKCLGCFEGLPLASIIEGRVYTAHGGLFRSVNITPSKRSKGKKNRRINLNPEVNSLSLGSLEELSRARRSVLDPPWEGLNLIPGDVLWSDPSMSPGLSPNKERGIGLLWGPDCTEDFLKKFHLKLIIRSHEGPDAREKRPGLSGMDEGYTIDHVVESGKLITLFSAPDYPQFQATEERHKNKGAYIVLEPPDFDTPRFHSFEAITPRPKIVFFVFSPALVASYLAKTITLSTLAEMLFMPVNILLTFVIGSTLGWILAKITKTPPHLQGLVIGSCAAGNLGNLLLIIIPAVCEETNSPFGDSTVCTTYGQTYASASIYGGIIYVFDSKIAKMNKGS